MSGSDARKARRKQARRGARSEAPLRLVDTGPSCSALAIEHADGVTECAAADCPSPRGFHDAAMSCTITDPARRARLDHRCEACAG
jgi:hypothetical protein